MKNYSKPISVIANIMQILLWIGTALLAAAFLCSFINPDFVMNLLENSNQNLDILGLSVENYMSIGIARLMLAYGVAGVSLYAMIARNITLISKNLCRQKTFSEENTPFSKDNVRMVREIGIFSISVSLTGLIVSWIIFGICLAAKVEAEVSMSVTGIFFGLVVLYLSSIFQYGVRLQKDVEGLV